jgi:hypothetical protein
MREFCGAHRVGADRLEDRAIADAKAPHVTLQTHRHAGFAITLLQRSRLHHTHNQKNARTGWTNCHADLDQASGFVAFARLQRLQR